MTDKSILSVKLREEIVSNFEDHLRARGSPILDSADAHEQMLGQARSILDEVVDGYRATTDSIDLGPTLLHVETGASQAIEGMHPADSLRAASVLFETALPSVRRAFSENGRSDAEATLTLHRVVMRWVVSCAVSHTRFVFTTIRDSHRAELARLARDLHDRAAHAIGVGIQNLELHEVYASRDAARAQEKLHRAREAMRQALDSVRHFSVELRTTVRPEELEQALTDYLVSTADGNILTSVRVTGNTALLPQEMCGEVYFALREAIHNALVHSNTTQLEVTVKISETHLHARVSDTGRGFSVEKTTNTLGLSSMRERVQLVGGQLRLSSLVGHGTTVEISVPLGRAAR